MGAELGDQILVAGGELEDGGAGGAEGLYLLAGEDVVVLPVVGELEEGADAAVERLLLDMDECGIWGGKWVVRETNR